MSCSLLFEINNDVSSIIGGYVDTIRNKKVLKEEFLNHVEKSLIKSFNIDARGEKRFLGLQPEPREGLRSGHVEGSINLPFQLLINNDRTLKKVDELKRIFENKKIDIKKDKAFLCGSSITSAILGLANSLITDKKPKIYDGSWAEYGLEK